MALAPCVNPTPVPLATALMLIPVVPAKDPAVKAPVMVMAFKLIAAVAGLALVAQLKQVLSKIM